MTIWQTPHRNIEAGTVVSPCRDCIVEAGSLTDNKQPNVESLEFSSSFKRWVAKKIDDQFVNQTCQMKWQSTINFIGNLALSKIGKYQVINYLTPLMTKA